MNLGAIGNFLGGLFNRPQPQPAPRPAPRKPSPQINLAAFSKVLSQVPNIHLQGIEQLTHQPVTLGSVAHDAYTGVTQPVLRGGQALTNVQQNMRTGRAPLQGINTRQFGTDAATTGLNVATLGRGKAVLGAGKLSGKVLQGLIDGTVLGGAQGAVGTYANKGTPLDYAKNIGLGAGIGAAAGVGLPLAGAGIKAGARETAKGINAGIAKLPAQTVHAYKVRLGETPEAAAERIQAGAIADKPHFIGAVKGAAESVGGVLPAKAEANAIKGIKSDGTRDITRMVAKITKKGQITDPLRSTIVAQDPEAATAIIDHMRKQGYELWIDPKTGKPDLTNRHIGRQEGDYTDVAMKFVKHQGDPIIKELQLIQPNMLEVKSTVGHAHYEAQQAAEGLLAKTTDPVERATLQSAIDHHVGVQKQLYEGAYRLDNPARSTAAPMVASDSTSLAPNGTPTLAANALRSATDVPPKNLTPTSASRNLSLDTGIVPPSNLTIAHPVTNVNKPKAETKVPTPDGLKERGFTKTLKSQDDPVFDLVAHNIPGYKPITNKGTAKKAAAQIAKDPSAAYAKLVTKKQLTSADDVATGNLLLHKYVEEGDIETAIELGHKLGIDGTKLGQAVQAYALWKKTTPEGILREASKQAFKAGKDLDPAKAKELVAKATKIAEMPEGLDKAKAIKEMLGETEKLGRTWKNLAEEIFNMPRALMATLDFSAPLRQGAVLGSRYPKEFGKAFGEMFKYWAKPGYYEQAMYNIAQKDTYGLMKSHGLAVDGAQQLTGTEEQFLNSLLESDTAKKFGIGHVIAASDRAYSGFLTKLRADVFDKTYKDFSDSGVKLNKKELDSLTKFINSASGRGQGKVTDQVSRLQVLFSARLWKSRLDNLNPAYYARLDPKARKLALQSTASFAAITGSLLGLAKLSGMEVNTDPRSADFAKAKVGNTRFDILGGHQQNIRLLAQMITGTKVNSVTGEEQTLGPDRGFGKPSRLDLLYQFLENKENPVIAFATKALRGTDQVGNPINLPSEVAKLGIPLTIQSIADTTKDTGSLAKGIAMNIPGVFGVGTQTYSQAPPKTPKQQAMENSIAKSTKDAAAADANGTRGKQPAKPLSEGKKTDNRVKQAQAKINPDTPKDVQKILIDYAKLDTLGKEKYNNDPDKRYQLKLARYKNDVVNGSKEAPPKPPKIKVGSKAKVAKAKRAKKTSAPKLALSFPKLAKAPHISMPKFAKTKAAKFKIARGGGSSGKKIKLVA